MPITVDQIDQAGLERKVQDIVSQPESIPNANAIAGLADVIAKLQAAQIPTGLEADWPVGGAPAGWLAEDGSVQEQSKYPELYGVIGATFNTGGEGASQFRLPNNAGTVIKADG